MSRELSPPGDDEAEDTVVLWSQRKARIVATVLALIVAAILGAHVFLLAEPNPGLLLISFPLMFAAFPWAGRATSPTEAVRITPEGVVDKTRGYRLIPWDQIHDVHLKQGQLGLELVDAPPPALWHRLDRFLRSAKGDYFIPANSLDVPDRDLLELIDVRLQRRLFDGTRSEPPRLDSPGDDI